MNKVTIFKMKPELFKNKNLESKITHPLYKHIREEIKKYNYSSFKYFNELYSLNLELDLKENIEKNIN